MTRERPGGNRANPEFTSPNHPDFNTAGNGNRAQHISAQSVSWWAVHEFVAPMLTAAGSWPMAGSPAWRALPDTDPAKLAAVLDGGRHHSLRVEIAQEALADASRAVSQSADWPAIADQLRQRRAAYIPRERAS